MKEAYEKWEKEFRKSPKGLASLKMLKKLEPISPKNYQYLESEVLLACFQSIQFGLSGDDYDIKRDRFSAISKIPSTQKGDILLQIDEVVKSLEENSDIYDEIVAEGMLAEGAEIEHPAFNQHVKDHKSVIVYYLKQYKKGIEQLRNNKSTLPMREESWVYGNIRFPERIDKKNHNNRSKAPTLLMFQLAVFFKLWTHPEGQKLFNNGNDLYMFTRGIKIPEEGNLHEDIIASFVNSSFRNEPVKRHSSSMKESVTVFTGEDIANRLEKIDDDAHLVLWDREDFPKIK